ncbi:Fpg/Nei family DNA glycosylase [Streptomyces sp. NPDC052236]|uniref:Fpg/Nei family DNA glycosylase n=1 Tax=Streptomyces sp. NPDC052236 TaxID=3365686 RepID=UPI0037D59707
MPELPDVEAFRQVLASCAQGRRIERVEVRDAGVLHGVSGQQLRNDLEGRKFAEPERHGKWLLARTDDGPTLMLHFGMTGQLLCCRPEDAAEAHDRVVFSVAGDRQLRYRDQRKLQGVWLTDDSGVAGMLDDQGPDAMAVNRTDFDAALAGRRGRIKSVLTDQSVLAGLGNLLADEILWRARVHPARPADGLTDAERRQLYTVMRRTLRSAVDAGCVPPRKSWLTGRRDDPEAACPRCGEPLRRERIAGRGTVWCPPCQPDS